MNDCASLILDAVGIGPLGRRNMKGSELTTNRPKLTLHVVASLDGFIAKKTTASIDSRLPERSTKPEFLIGMPRS